MTTLTKQTMRCLITLGIVLTLFSCATTKKDWHEANRKGTVEAIGQFLQTHPESKQASKAKRLLEEMRAEEDWEKAKSMNTIGGYRDYLNKHLQSKQAGQASAQLEQLELERVEQLELERVEQLALERDWKQTKSSGKIASYNEFIQKHPRSKQVAEARQELKLLEADRDWKSAQDVNSVRAFTEFLKSHSSSQYSAEARKCLTVLQADEAWNDATSKNSDEGWLDFVMDYWNTPKVEAAIERLKNYKVIRAGGVITWATLGGKTISTDGATYYLNDNSGLMSPRLWQKLGPAMWIGELKGCSEGLRVATGMALVPMER